MRGPGPGAARIGANRSTNAILRKQRSPAPPLIDRRPYRHPRAFSIGRRYDPFSTEVSPLRERRVRDVEDHTLIVLLVAVSLAFAWYLWPFSQRDPLGDRTRQSSLLHSIGGC